MEKRRGSSILLDTLRKVGRIQVYSIIFYHVMLTNAVSSVNNGFAEMDSSPLDSYALARIGIGAFVVIWTILAICAAVFGKRGVLRVLAIVLIAASICISAVGLFAIVMLDGETDFFEIVLGIGSMFGLGIQLIFIFVAICVTFVLAGQLNSK